MGGRGREIEGGGTQGDGGRVFAGFPGEEAHGDVMLWWEGGRGGNEERGSVGGGRRIRGREVEVEVEGGISGKTR